MMKHLQEDDEMISSGTLHIDDFVDYLSLKYKLGTRYVRIESKSDNDFYVQLLPELGFRKKRR